MGMELLSNNNAQHTEMEEADYTDYEAGAILREILRSKALDPKGWNADYNSLILGVSNTTENLDSHQVGLLVVTFKTLSKAVSDIHMTHHSDLLGLIFQMNMWEMWRYGLDVLDAFVELIICLAASPAKCLDMCVEMLLRNFMPPEKKLFLLNPPRGTERKQQILDRVHAALKDIITLMPQATTKLETAIVNGMPYFKGAVALNALYVENMLRLERGELGEFVGRRMLIEVMKRLLEIDVEVGWEDILQEDFTKGIFDMEFEDVEDEDERMGVDVYAEKLDTLMVYTCEHIKLCAEEGRLSEVFEILLISFEKIVLTAYKAKFSQFVIFYACSLDPENCGVRFATKLADIFEHGRFRFVRMSAVAYLASYLSRGKFLSSSIVAGALERLVDWCFKYCTLQDGVGDIINPEDHGIFYSACQAVMYVLCFRMRFMLDDPHLKSQLLRIPIESILRHPLDPLKVCLPSIVTEFLRQAKAAELFPVSDNSFFSDLLESDLSKAYGGKERLDTFFPFDPCVLKKCDRFFRPNFTYWSMVKTTYDEDVNSDEDGEDDFVDDRNGHFTYDAMGRTYDEDAADFDEFENSMNKMSITPKKYRSVSDFQMSMQMPARIRPSTSPESL